MNSKDFKIGDEVEYELSWWGTPTWTNNTCRGGSGRWEAAKVVGIKTQQKPQFLITQNSKGKTYNWPLECNTRYDETQWSWGGYLRKISATNKKLELLTIQCQCGAEKCKTTHSNWCPKYCI